MFGIALWFGALFALRLMAKADPKLRHVCRHFKPYYPARSTPSVTTRRVKEAIQMIEAIAIAIAVLDRELKLKKHRAKDAGRPICSITPPWSMTA